MIEEAPAPGMTGAFARADGRGRGRRGEGGRLCRRRHGRVRRRRHRRTARRRLLVHRDEHAASGRASGDRGGHRRSISSTGNSGSPRAKSCRSSRSKSASTATRSKRAFMPRIPSTASCRQPARSWRWNCRPISASTAVSKPGGEVTPFYDPMIAKLIAHAPTREAALDRMTAALDHTLDRRRAQQCRVSRRTVPRAQLSATARSIPVSSSATLRRSAPHRIGATQRRSRSASFICSTLR